MDNKKLANLLNLMKKNEVDQILIADPASIFYLTGKWVHPGHRLYTMLIDRNENYHLFVHEMFQIEEDLGVEKHYFKDTDDPVELLSKYVIEEGNFVVDKEWPTRFFLDLNKLRPKLNYTANPLIELVRRVKNDEEIKLMKEASKINDRAIELISQRFNSKGTEKEATEVLASIYEELGTEGFSFSPIICYGENAANPHHMPDNISELKDGDVVLFDIGCIKNDYCSDMTRTFFWKSVTDKQREVYNIVREANERAIKAIKPGMKFSEIDAVARDYITESGYGDYFIHRLGHCIGMEVHEYGDVSATNDEIIEVGNIFSIEPGIYLTGEFGVRIEDLVLVTEDGCINLNSYPKELQILGI